MNRSARKDHSIDLLFSILLFGIYILFLLLMLLFSAKAYQHAVKGQSENYHLRTAMSYLTVKIRQHDNGKDVFLGELQGTEAICLSDQIEGKEYITYIYLYDGQLKELFTPAQSQVSLSMGTDIASLDSFIIEETPENFYRISMEDHNGAAASFLIHPGAPAA